jgi:dTDP-4-dehydrorhamnose reductase
MNSKFASEFEIWAGFECTINRVNDRYYNQLEKSGLLRALPDFSHLKSFGIKKFRSPFLWELSVDHNISEKFDWRWNDELYEKLQSAQIEPIAGFVHHGSGPRFTDLLDPDFPEKLTCYAREFAKRYPQIKFYTPINEPLTTARFSTLYGHWYPHKKDDQSFVRALFHQVKATILVMQAVREINPAAQLVQTEDLGHIQGTKLLQYQVNFENERRWLTFDLLCGKISEKHFLYNYLVENGLTPEELFWINQNSCPPNLIGINHYLLSHRYLDENLDRYPAHTHGGNAFHRYADVGTVDTSDILPLSPEALLEQVWQRYQIPIAVTEVHLRGYREDQLRWLFEIKTSVDQLRKRHIPVQAITLWSLFGAWNWNTLCTFDHNFYESGAYDLRSERPRPTAIIEALKTWPQINIERFPVLGQLGWWRKSNTHLPSRPLLITGAGGTLGKAFVQICRKRNIPYIALGRKDLDITNTLKVEEKILTLRPWAVINAAGYVRVDQAETEQNLCREQNILGPKNLADICSREKIKFLHFSSDLVFSGEGRRPYTELDEVDPVNVYGFSKAISEKEIFSCCPESLIIRTSSFFSPWDTYNFVFQVLSAVGQKRSFDTISDVTMSPTYVPDLVNLSLDLLIDNEKGIVHLTNDGATTWCDFAHKTITIAKKTKNLSLNRRYLVSRSIEELNLPARRPNYSALTSNRIKIMTNYEEALFRYFNEVDIKLLENL